MCCSCLLSYRPLHLCFDYSKKGHLSAPFIILYFHARWHTLPLCQRQEFLDVFFESDDPEVVVLFDQRVTVRHCKGLAERLETNDHALGIVRDSRVLEMFVAVRRVFGDLHDAADKRHLRLDIAKSHEILEVAHRVLFADVLSVSEPDFYLIENPTKKEEINLKSPKKDSSIISFSHIKGEAIVELVTNNYYIHNNINKLYSEIKSFIFDQYHSFFQINYNRKSTFSRKFLINSTNGIYTYASIKTNLYPNINEVKLGKTNYILHQYDSSTIYLYIKINDLSEIENDIMINVKIEGLEIYKIYNISLTGYFSYSKNLNIDFSNNKKFPISKGFYDNITNIGIIKFKSKSMKMYFDKKNVNLLVINILDMNYNENQSLDVMLKVTAISNLLLLNNNTNNDINTDIDSKSQSYIYTIP